MLSFVPVRVWVIDNPTCSRKGEFWISMFIPYNDIIYKLRVIERVFNLKEKYMYLCLLV